MFFIKGRKNQPPIVLSFFCCFSYLLFFSLFFFMSKVRGPFGLVRTYWRIQLCTLEFFLLEKNACNNKLVCEDEIWVSWKFEFLVVKISRMYRKVVMDIIFQICCQNISNTNMRNIKAKWIWIMWIENIHIYELKNAFE